MVFYQFFYQAIIYFIKLIFLTQGSWTPFHTDVFGSYSWSSNIVGRKRWIFLPPGEERKLTNRWFNDSFCKPD